MVVAVFAAFGLAAVLLFRFVRPAHAVAVTCFAGWLLLPVADYPAAPESGIAYWITGSAVPSDLLLNKMWWAPFVALVGALMTDGRRVVRWQLSLLDVPMALWCLWPLVQWFFVSYADPAPGIAVAYLCGVWGVPWLLGRLYFGGREGGRLLITAMVAGLMVIVPIALLESVMGPKVYGWVYQVHPFVMDGQQRYVGFRPLAFFENGNQYGIWVAATALAALWLWRAPETRRRSSMAVVAVVALATALMSQSVGAIVMLIAGLILAGLTGRRLGGWALGLAVLSFMAAGTIYLSGAIPFRAIADKTALGQEVVEAIRSIGRGSFTWRIARDQSALPLIHEHLFIGAAQWDWWRPINARPWGLALLVIGQFGLIGFLLAFGSILGPALREMYARWHPGTWRANPALPLAVIVLMAVGDALFNSFFFYPAIVAAGSLATGGASREAPIGR